MAADEPLVPQPTQARADYAKEMAHTGDAGALAAPRNVDVPLVTGDGTVGATLNCTMGNWDGEPTGYAYSWQPMAWRSARRGRITPWRRAMRARALRAL